MLIAADRTIASCGAGSKKKPTPLRLAWVGTADPRRHLLIRRSLIPNDSGIRGMAFCRCFAPKLP